MSVRLAEFQRQYVANFPTELPKKAAQGVVAAIAINLIAGSALSVALVAGAIAVSVPLYGLFFRQEMGMSAVLLPTY